MDWVNLGKRVEDYRVLIIEDVAKDPFLGDRNRFTQQLNGESGSLKSASKQRRAFLLGHESLRPETAKDTDRVN